MEEDKVRTFIESEIAQKEVLVAKETTELARLKSEFESESLRKQGIVTKETVELEGLKRLLAVHLGEITLPGNTSSADAVADAQAQSLEKLKVEPRGYKDIAIVLAKYVFQGGKFTTRQMAMEMTARVWKIDHSYQVKSKNLTAVLGVQEDFMCVSTSRRDYVYQLADKHIKSHKY